VTDKFNVEPRNGLEEGDQVVVAGQAGLKDGALVRLPGDKDEEEETAEADDEASAAERASL
jgi:hypothetical protein